MNQSYYVNLRDKVAARAKRDERNAKALLELAIGIQSAFKEAVPLTGALQVGSVDQAGELVVDTFHLATRSKMNVAVQVKFKGPDNNVILAPVVQFEVTTNGEDFDVVCLHTGKKVFVAFDDRKSVPALRPVVDLIDEPLSKAVAEFENV